MNTTTIAANAANETRPGYRWYCLAILTLIYSCHFLDRAVISIVAEPMRKEFQLSDSQLGLLTGLAYAVMFALASIPMGMLVDRFNRRNLLSGIVFLWSGATALCGFVQNYAALIVARMGVGATEAGGSPASLSLIADIFPPHRRATAVGLFYLNTVIGAAGVFFIGGYVAVNFGWRTAFFIAGVPGMLLALLLLLTVNEPRRGGADIAATKTDPLPLGAALRSIFSQPTLVALLVAVPLATSGVSALGAWLPPFFMRVHEMDLKEASFVMAIATGPFAAAGSVIGGALSDRIGRRNPARRFDLCLVIMLIAIPLAIGTTMATKGSLSVAFTFLTIGMVFSVIPIGFGSMLVLSAAGVRGITVATMQLACNLVGYGFGPYFVGVFSDMHGGTDSLRFAILEVMLVCCVTSAIAFWFARTHVVRGLADGSVTAT